MTNNLILNCSNYLNVWFIKCQILVPHASPKPPNIQFIIREDSEKWQIFPYELSEQVIFWHFHLKDFIKLLKSFFFVVVFFVFLVNHLVS